MWIKHSLGALGIALAILWASLSGAFAQATPIGPPNQIVCNKIGLGLSLATGTAQLVTGVTGQAISLCGWELDPASANPTVQMVYGTGATCTTPTNLSPVLTLASIGIAIVDHVGYAWSTSAPGQSLCAIVAGTTPVINIIVYFAQF